MYKAATHAYLQTQIATTTQADVLLMLYDGALKFLHQARERIIAKDVAAKGILLTKALNIINELQCSLNKEKGGELAVNLSKLYFYCTTRLLSANLRLDVGMIDEVVRILEGLRSAFAQIKSGAPAPDQAPEADRPPVLSEAARAAVSAPTPNQPQARPMNVVIPQGGPKPAPGRTAPTVSRKMAAAIYGAKQG